MVDCYPHHHFLSSFYLPILISLSISYFSLLVQPHIIMSTSNNDLRCNNLKCRGFLSMEGQAVVTTCSRASPNHSYLTDLVRYLLQCVLFQERHGGILNCEWNHAVSCATTLFASSLTCPACNQSLQEPYVSLFDYDLHITFLLTDPRIAVTILWCVANA